LCDDESSAAYIKNKPFHFTEKKWLTESMEAVIKETEGIGLFDW
jgi:hypothetical protein